MSRQHEKGATLAVSIFKAHRECALRKQRRDSDAQRSVTLSDLFTRVALRRRPIGRLYIGQSRVALTQESATRANHPVEIHARYIELTAWLEKRR